MLNGCLTLVQERGNRKFDFDHHFAFLINFLNAKKTELFA